MATSDRWTDKQTGEQKEQTEWHRISLFNRLGEIAAQYLRKGSSVYIEGSLHTRKYTDNQGIERYTTEIKANQMQMLGGRNDGGYQGGGFNRQDNYNGGYQNNGGYNNPNQGGYPNNGGYPQNQYQGNQNYPQNHPQQASNPNFQKPQNGYVGGHPMQGGQTLTQGSNQMHQEPANYQNTPPNHQSPKPAVNSTNTFMQSQPASPNPNTPQKSPKLVTPPEAAGISDDDMPF